MLTFYLSAPVLLAAEPDGTSDLPASSLKAPRGEIQPSWWEQHSAFILAGMAVLLAMLGVAIWFLLRPKPPLPPVPAAETGRRQLDALQQQPEDGALLSRTSQILHHYLTAAFGVAADELTTAELCRAVAQNREIGPELAGEIGEFLRQCDVRKFAPQAPKTPVGAVARALAIIEHCESRLAQLRASVAADSAPKTNVSPASSAVGQIANRS